MTLFYTETGSTDPYYNLAFEEYILSHKRQGDWLILWQNANTVVVGLNQNTLEEIDVGFVHERGVRVVRRRTGGGAVYHDLGNVNYSFIADAGDTADLSMARFTDAVCAALASLGVEASPSGRNDITIQGKKVSGTAQRLDQGRVLFHGTLLFRSDPDMIAGALRADPDKFTSKSTKSIRSRVGNISDFLSEEITVGDFILRIRDALAGHLAATTPLQTVVLHPDELVKVEQLAENQYRTWAWNYGTSPAFGAARRARFDGGSLSIAFAVEHGRIAQIRFQGDFMARLSLDPLEDALIGCRFAREDIATIMDGQPIGEMFGAITQDEILGLLFT